MSEITNLVPIGTAESPQEVMTRGQATAAACRQIVLQCSMKLQGKKYIKAEGWQALAAACGYSPRISEVQVLENEDIRAVCELVRLSDGEVVARAEGYVGVDETTWSRRPRYARRAMAQTRATSRACRSALAWIVPLLDAGLETTPAEEIPHEPHPQIEAKPPGAATPDELRHMFAHAEGRGFPMQNLKALLGEHFGVRSSQEMTSEQVKQAVKMISDLGGIN